MQNILQLIIRFGSFITFVLLEIIALYLIVNFNHSQRSIYLNSTKVYRGEVSERVQNYNRYFNLTEVNDSLRAQNALLLQESFSTSQIVQNTKEKDSLKYDVIPASVVGNSFNSRNNHITLDVGTKDGIQPDMGVLGIQGVLGIVKTVSDHYALVSSLLHSQIKISCTVKPHLYPGTLTWKDNNPQYMSLSSIPKYVNINKGDTVVTNGFSTIFPKDIIVGHVADLKVNAGSNDFDIKVKLINDIPGAHSAYVIINADNEEIQSLQKIADNE